MRPVVVYIKDDEKIEITKEKLEKMLDDAYNQGVKDGREESCSSEKMYNTFDQKGWLYHGEIPKMYLTTCTSTYPNSFVTTKCTSKGCENKHECKGNCHEK